MNTKQNMNKKSQRLGGTRDTSSKGSKNHRINHSDVSENTSRQVTFQVNGKAYRLQVGRLPGMIEPHHTLAYTLRETLGLTGTKIACNEGACGACTVLMDGEPVLSCMLLTIECEGEKITTIEGLEDPETGQLHPLQQSFVEHTAFQCGFCTPGILMSTKALLDRNPEPPEGEIKEALAGHFCRCISHYHVLEAVKDVVRKGGGYASGKTI